jgi:hypothetical protein
MPILMDTVQVGVAGAFMPAVPPKAIGGTHECIFGSILKILQHNYPLRGFNIWPILISFCSKRVRSLPARGAITLALA